MHNASTQPSTKAFKPKDAILVFSSVSLVCMSVIFGLVITDILMIEDFLSFQHPLGMVLYSLYSLIFLILYGVLVTLCTPSGMIDDTTRAYEHYSFPMLLVFLFVGAAFEELLLRGIIQNLCLLVIQDEWSSIAIATTLFVAGHVHYYKKPIMLLNIAIPGFVFGWIYVETSNILAPIMVHFLANLVMTLLFRYQVIKLRE